MKLVKALKSNSKTLAFMVFEIPNACSKSASPSHKEFPPPEFLIKGPTEFELLHVLKKIPSVKGKLPP